MTSPQVVQGKVIAQGDNKRPAGLHKLLTYKLEEIDLPAPVELEIRLKKERFTTALRLTIYSESIQGAYAIWLDDVSLPGVFGLGPRAIGTLIYDRSILRDGAVISVQDGRGLSSLPELLKLPQSFKALITSAALGTNVIDRFVFDGPWYRRDGLVFAHNKAELIALNETLPLNLAETGQYLGFALALTGANTGGNPNGLDCANWTSTTSGEGFSSVVNWVGPNWLSNAGTLCSGPQFPGDVAIKLMCLSDSDVLFHDEFEQLPSAL